MRYNPNEIYFTDEKIAEFFDEEAATNSASKGTGERLKGFLKQNRKRLFVGLAVLSALSGAAIKVDHDIEQNVMFKNNLEDMQEDLHNKAVSLKVRTSDGATHLVEGTMTLIRKMEQDRQTNVFSPYFYGNTFTVERPQDYEESKESDFELACNVAAHIGRQVIRVAREEEITYTRFGYTTESVEPAATYPDNAVIVVDDIYLNGERFSTEACS